MTCLGIVSDVEAPVPMVRTDGSSEVGVGWGMGWRFVVMFVGGVGPCSFDWEGTAVAASRLAFTICRWLKVRSLLM